MCRLLKEVASGGAVSGDTTTLEDFTVLAKTAPKRRIAGVPLLFASVLWAS
jgi:hypothetical protein